jgi:hypothetical protein
MYNMEGSPDSDSSPTYSKPHASDAHTEAETE